MFGVMYAFESPERLGLRRYKIDLNRAEEPAWRSSNDSTQRLLSIATLAEDILGELHEKDREHARMRRPIADSIASGERWLRVGRGH